MIIKPVAGWHGYFITSCGKVLSTRRTRKQIMLKPNRIGRGFLAVSLRDGKKSATLYVHRLVLAAFKGPQPHNVRTVHLDGNIQNNDMGNLAWTKPKPAKAILTKQEKAANRFHDRYTPMPESGCWLWDTMGTHGYGEFQIPGKTRKAHRASWILHYGDIPEGLWVLHKCDNPLCVNPKHLFLGTAKDNTNDRVSKGRYIGEQKAHAKLTTKDVVEIKQVHTYFGRKELGDMYGVSGCTIQDIAVGRNWKHVNLGKWGAK